MKNSKSIIIIILILIIIAMFFIILNMKNKNIEQEKTIKEQLQEATTDNSYISLSTHMSILEEKKKEINSMQNTAGKATATADKILKDYTAYKNGQLITGTMANNGAVTKTLNAGGSYIIPAGYHNGNGKVTANSLATQTQATATASDILSGKTAWVNGSLITGNISSNPSNSIPYISKFSQSIYTHQSWGGRYKPTYTLTIIPNGANTITLGIDQSAGGEYSSYGTPSISNITNGTYSGLVITPTNNKSEVSVTIAFSVDDTVTYSGAAFVKNIYIKSFN